MKIALCVYYHPSTPHPRGEARQLAASIALLRSRTAALREVGCRPVVLGQVADVVSAVEDCRRQGAHHLWVFFASPARELRYRYLQNPDLFRGTTLYIDGLVSPNLPPTQGQLRYFASLGIHCLSPGETPASLQPREAVLSRQ